VLRLLAKDVWLGSLVASRVAQLAIITLPVILTGGEKSLCYSHRHCCY